MGKFKSSRKKTVSVIAATAMSLFSLLAVFSATIAWFAMNKNVDGNGMEIGVARISGHLQNVYIHSFNSANSNQNTYSFNKTPLASFSYSWENRRMVADQGNPSSWNMGDFTSLDKDHPLLMLFAFDKDYASTTVGDMYIKGITTVGGDSLVTTTVNGSLETSGGGFLGARNAQGAPFYTLPQTQVKDAEHPESILIKRDPVYNDQGQQATYQDGTLKYNDYYALSSVVTFKNQTFSNSAYETFSSGSYLSFTRSALQSDESFTTINNATDKYVFNQTPYLYKSDGSETVKYVALIIEYSPEAIGYIYSTYLGDSGLNKYDSLLRFNCDWSLEVL